MARIENIKSEVERPGNRVEVPKWWFVNIIVFVSVVFVVSAPILVRLHHSL
ncbi:hypothetical protein ACOALA_20685 (plasmid) [Alicyclobacillus acidoterrestris]|uniref:hypothetical protein n=1 Tax=Alicyclobacillus acidoterrestris TaxID=1450 RepID=UPI003F538E8F